MSLRDELLTANERYAASFALADLGPRPRRALAVLTCMDARLEPLAALGLEPGDAHVLRNGGAEATDDVLRSLELAQRLDVREVLVVGHDRCIARTFAEGSPTAEAAVRRAVAAIAGRFPGLAVSGVLYDESTGRIRPVD
ncbi:MAG TPA: carbonic anhydrase [Gaiellaceae bacterium]